MPAKKNTSAKAPAASATWRHKLASWTNAICFGIFAIVVLLLLPVLNYWYVIELEDLNTFTATSAYLRECLSMPGGIVAYVGSFLQQFFYYPWLGAVIYTALLLLLGYAIAHTLRVPRPWRPLALLPSALCLFAAIIPGFLIYALKGYGWVFTLPIGILTAVGLFYIYSRLPRLWMRIIGAIVLPLFYPLLGVYALLACLLCIIYELFSTKKWWLAIIVAVLSALVPQIYFYNFESHTMYARLYLSGLPYFSQFTLWKEWALSGSLIITAFLALVFSIKPIAKTKESTARLTACAIFAVSVVCVFAFRFNDKNFNLIMEQDAAIADGDYESVLKASRNIDFEPTRITVLYNHAALFHRGEAGDSLYSYLQGGAPFNVEIEGYPSIRLVGARHIYLRFGRVYDSYRWSMEDFVEFGPRMSYVKTLLKAALINGEYDVARRYVDILEHTTFHKAEARKYKEYIDNPELIEHDQELAQIKKLTGYVGYIGGDDGMIETYLASNVAALRGGCPELLELSLQFNISRKDIKEFWPRMIAYTQMGKPLPRHYQEAIILYSGLEHQYNWEQFPIDKAVADRFDSFMRMAKVNAKYDEAHNRVAFAPLFGDTFWYYYFFITNLETT